MMDRLLERCGARFTGVLILFAFIAPSYLIAADATTIRMTDAGFEPAEVTIKAGDMVIFRNVGAVVRWPASNIHPTHGVYPGSGIEKCGTDESVEAFDACDGIQPGSSYAFTFTQPGEWRFHDHLDPVSVGTINVEGEKPEMMRPSMWARARDVLGAWVRKMRFLFSPAARAEELARFDLFALVKEDAPLRDAVRDHGGKALMQKLIEQSGGGSLRDCHQEAHKLGRAAFEVQGKDAFKEGDSSCHSGFYHGAMESFLRERGTSDLAASIKDVCDAFKTSFSRFECLHGVGHGLLAYADYDLPKSLDSCEELADQFSISSCYGGVFMENIVTAQGSGATEGHTTTWVNREDPQFPCTSFTKSPDALYQCYLMQTSWMLTITDYDFPKVAKQCLNAPRSMVGTCYQSLGRDAAGYTLRNPERILAICEEAPKEWKPRCIIGAVNVIIDFWGEKLEGQASELCALAAVGRNECYATLVSRLGELYQDPQNKARACATVAPEYQNLCR